MYRFSSCIHWEMNALLTCSHSSLFLLKNYQISWFTSSWNWHHLLWKGHFSSQPLVRFQAVELFCSASEWEDPSRECSLHESVPYRCCQILHHLAEASSVSHRYTNPKLIWQKGLAEKERKKHFILNTIVLLSSCE